MKKIKIFSLFVCLAMLAIACHNDDDERGVQLRTVLVYIAGDNSLRSFATEDLAEMTEGMQSVDDNSYNLLVYIDTGSGPKLIRLKKDKKKNVVQQVIATYESRNSVDVSNMKEVVNTAFSEYPASFNAGIIIAPIAATVAGPDPVNAAKIAQQIIVIIPVAPVTRPQILLTQSVKRLESPACSIR